MISKLEMYEWSLEKLLYEEYKYRGQIILEFNKIKIQNDKMSKKCQVPKCYVKD